MNKPLNGRMVSKMEVGGLYNFVLLLVLVGMILGVGILVLDKFASSPAVTSTASSALNDTRDELAGVASNWLGIIVIVVVAAIILGLVIRSFGGGGKGQR
jgi:hypothetical protein